MDIKPALKQQYHAALKTLRLAIEKCPDNLWNDPADEFAAFWRVAYHTLFFTHLYLQPDQAAFRQWEKHRDEAHAIGLFTWENNRAPKPCDPYTRDEIMEYWQYCDSQLDSWVDTVDLASPDSGFHWYKMPKMEHQLVNLRHIQHHAAALASRLRRLAKVDVPWVGRA